MEGNDFNRLEVGLRAAFTHTVTEEDVELFAKISGDYNDLHMDNAYASKTKFGKRVVHGMFLGALCSRLVGMHLPGRNSLYLRQTLTFKNPTFIGDTVAVSGEIIAKSISTKIITILITIMRDEVILLQGEGQVQYM